MAMSSKEMIEFFGQQAERAARGLEAARTSGNYQLAAMNYRQRFKSLLMQGLLQWRLAINPRKTLYAAVDTIGESLRELSLMNGDTDIAADVPVERARIVATLLDYRLPELDESSLTDDRRLDSILARKLVGECDDAAWNDALEKLSSVRGSELARATYECYGQLLRKPMACENLDRADELFAGRKKDSFFAGGDQTEGGGNDNAVTVDYRLGAVMKAASVDGENIHQWRW